MKRVLTAMLFITLVASLVACSGRPIVPETLVTSLTAVETTISPADTLPKK
jgi:hypothetical protein